MNTNSINLWQVQIKPWKLDFNMEKIREQIEATKTGWILILPEMVIPGYLIWDKWLDNEYIKECKSFNEEIIKLSWEYNITIVWGNIDFDENKKNEDWSIRKYNTAYLASNWKLLKTQYKTLLPNYRMFDDKRYFTSLKDLALEENISLEEYYKPVEVLIDWVKVKVSLLICEDLWNINNDYPIDPLKLTKLYSPDLIAVPSCSPFGLEKAKFRDKLLQIQSKDTIIAYVNPIWIQNSVSTEFVFDWWSSIYENWKFVRWIKDYRDNEEISEIEHRKKIEQIKQNLIYGLKEFWEREWKAKFYIWLSGWIDSAVVACLLVEAIWKENVIAINMPSKFNSETTKNWAKKLAKNLWITYKISDIESELNVRIRNYKDFHNKEPSDFELENIQARIRWHRLADLSPADKAFFTNNWNKDEITTGYATLYGDTSWAIAPIWDLTKQEVFELAKTFKEIPKEMIEQKPSAELSEKQDIDSGWWDPFIYEFLSSVTKVITEKKASLEYLLKKLEENKLEEFLWLKKWVLKYYFEDKYDIISEIEKIYRLQKWSFFKRRQLPPVIHISRWSYWTDFREASV